MRTRSSVWLLPLWFLVHLAVIYLSVDLLTTELAGWMNRTLFPFVHIPSSASSAELLFSHLFTFSFVPAFVLGFSAAKFEHRAAEFVWTVPAVILAYQLLTFSNTTSVLLQSASSPALHYYFAAAPAATDAHEFIWRSNPAAIPQALSQFRYTAPFYAGVTYSLASWIGIRLGRLAHPLLP